MHSPKNIRKFVHAAVCLHNLIRIREEDQGLKDTAPGVTVDREDSQGNITPGEWRQRANLMPIDPRRQGTKDFKEAQRFRKRLQAYFNSPDGAVPWQEARVKARLGVY